MTERVKLMDDPTLYADVVTVLDGCGKQVSRFVVINDFYSERGAINSLQSAVDNWLARTKKYTSKSFCRYVNSKGLNVAIPQTTFNRLLKKSEDLHT